MTKHLMGHIWNASLIDGSEWTLCGLFANRQNVIVDDVTKVTCKECLQTANRDRKTLRKK
jgi:hypothetical protein